LLVVHPETGVLLQHRVEWSHFGGTWGLPGGARHEGETAAQGAVREAREEAGVPEHGLRLRYASVLDLGWWSYTTVVASAEQLFAPVIGDAESLELRWVPVDQVASLELHPGFAASWPALAEGLSTRPVLIVDSANVVGSRPDGWWRDRAAANQRLADRLVVLAEGGIAADVLGVPYTTWWPEVRLITEGKAATVESAGPWISVLPAPADGDARIVEEVRSAVAEHAVVTVVSADRELGERVTALGARVIAPSELLALLD
jgi:8-oxo-dGTP pyrophosphatase MutT (NUDIX family)